MKAKLRTFPFEELEEADNDYAGFCLSCGERADNVEPDARKYKCECCDTKAVYGAAEIIIMGLAT